MRQAAELKTSQPIFPGQPPPLARVDHNKQNYAQPPPRQSSQVSQRSSSSSSSASVNRTAFPGQAPPTASTVCLLFCLLFCIVLFGLPFSNLLLDQLICFGIDVGGRLIQNEDGILSEDGKL